MPSHQGASKSRPVSVEQLSVSTGQVFVLDQFLLGSEMFSQKLEELSESGADEKKLTTLVKHFGGFVFEVGNGTFEVHRNVERRFVWLAPEGQTNDVPESLENARADNGSSSEAVEIHSRCMVISDLQLLADSKQMADFRELRARGREKDARDFLRTTGAAVRYGFDRFGEQLGVVKSQAEFPLGLYGEAPAEKQDVDQSE